MSANHIYKVEDIARYHSGKMTEAEMHAIERAAMRDPFLADAMEGFTYTDTPLEDMADLREKFLTSRSESKKGYIPFWLKIAAMLILVTGMSYLAYIINAEKSTNPIAVNKQETQFKSLPDQPSKLAADSTNTDLHSEVVTTEKKIRSERNLPARNVKLPTPDSTITAVVTDVPQTEQASRDEVQVTLSKKQTSREYRNTASRGAYSKTLLSYDDSTHAPVGGWDNFRQYVFENIEVPANAKGEKYSGVVVLSFEVSRNGKPKNVKVEAPLCDPCDKEAERVLVNGPKWKYGKDRRALEIKF